MRTINKILFIFLLVNGSLYAQPQGQGKCIMQDETLEKYKSQKIAFITEKLDLTTTEAQAFWPVYNAFEKEKDALKNQRHEVMKNCKGDVSALSDKDADALLDQLTKIETKEATLRADYTDKFKKVLPSKKVLLLYQAEKEFKTELLKKIKGHCGPGPHNSPAED